MRKRTTPREIFDAPWKKIVTAHFPAFIAFFAPKAHEDVDWSHDPEFLDKELRRISRGMKKGLAVADFLVKVRLKDGADRRVFTHIELQAQKNTDFPERMYVYNFRSYDIHRYPIYSLAILADDDPNWRPNAFGYEQWGNELGFRYNIVKLLDFASRLDELEKSDNPFALAVLAHLKTLETRGDADARFVWKLRLVRMLKNRGWNSDEVENLFDFIDWIMTIPEDLEDRFEAEVKIIEEEDKSMAELMSPWERRLEKRVYNKISESERKKGLEEGIITVILNIINHRFGGLSETEEIRLRKIESVDKLNRLSIMVVSSETLEDFERSIDS